MTAKRMYDIKEALEIIPLSRAGIYKACSEGKIPAKKIGTRVFIPACTRPNQRNTCRRCGSIKEALAAWEHKSGVIWWGCGRFRKPSKLL